MTRINLDFFTIITKKIAKIATETSENTHIHNSISTYTHTHNSTAQHNSNTHIEHSTQQHIAQQPRQQRGPALPSVSTAYGSRNRINLSHR